MEPAIRRAEPTVADDALMGVLAAGDGIAIDALLDRYGGGVLRYLTHVTGDRTASEDLTQEVFVRVLREARRYRPQGRFRAWLYTMAHRAALNHLRAEKRRRRWLGLIPFRRETERIETDPILRALDRVDEPFRSALVLVAVEGLSYEEAAAAAGCTVKTLSTRLVRARRRFREIWNEMR